MRINTNVSALNAQRQLGITNRSVSQSITRLSSGFRINRAADDAAGLGIANKLRGDIRSMTQAARNGEQANSLAQIAEGAVSGVASMLDRMKELATQANSDTVDSAGRERLDAEFQALVAEINRTAETTQFGQTKLINGSLGNSIDTNVATSTVLDPATQVASASISGTAADDYTFTNTVAGEITVSNSDGSKQQTVTLTAGGEQTVNFDVFGISLKLKNTYNNAATAQVGAGVLQVDAAPVDVDGNSVGGTFMVGSSGAYAETNGTGDLLTFSSLDLTDAGLGIDTLDVTNATNAQAALDGIDSAIGLVNEALGSIGAFQNRIENAMANLNTAIENLSASESVIRDLDMAAEMTKFSKNQILAQAGTAMLAQANASSQNVLQLLRG